MPLEIDNGAPNLCIDILWRNLESPVQDRGRLRIASHVRIGGRDLPKNENVARIEVHDTLQVSRGLLPPPLTSVDVGGQLGSCWVVWQCAFRNRDLRAC